MVDQILDELRWLDELTEADIEAMTMGERMALMWPMTVAEWARRGIDVTKQRMDRSAIQVTRRRPDGTEQILFRSHS